MRLNNKITKSTDSSDR